MCTIINGVLCARKFKPFGLLLMFGGGYSNDLVPPPPASIDDSILARRCAYPIAFLPLSSPLPPLRRSARKMTVCHKRSSENIHSNPSLPTLQLSMTPPRQEKSYQLCSLSKRSLMYNHPPFAVLVMIFSTLSGCQTLKSPVLSAIETAVPNKSKIPSSMDGRTFDNRRRLQILHVLIPFLPFFFFYPPCSLPSHLPLSHQTLLRRHVGGPPAASSPPWS